ncbi:GD21954 [Drosophila simulans]|uniref:GD21954 n=1 Tax=Drosophila simulans TaxID=7240 RepID=B4Q6F2_DROSI|nr:GD21954 [Drosophila simulans]
MRSMEATYPSLQCGCDSDFEYAAHSMPYKSMAGRDTSCGICNCQEIRGTEEDQESLKEHAEEQEDQARQSASGASLMWSSRYDRQISIPPAPLRGPRIRLRQVSDVRSHGINQIPERNCAAG